MKNTGRIGFVTVSTVQFLSVHRWNIGRGEMELMIKLERVGVLELFGDDLKFRMVAGEGVQDLRVTAWRAGRFEQCETVRRAIIESLWRKIFPLLKRRLHNRCVAMAGQAVGVVWRLHRAFAKVFMVAGGAGVVLHDVWLVKVMSLVTIQTGAIDGRARNRPRCCPRFR